MLALDDAVKVTQWLVKDGTSDEEIIRQEGTEVLVCA